MPRFFILFAFIMLSGFSVQDSNPAAQPKDERKAQDNLPKSHDPIWSLLGKTKVSLDKKQWKYSAEFPQEVKDLAGKEVTISGFMLPLEATEKFKHFIISKRTPTCAFCPPGEPNEIVDVWMDKAVSWDDDIIKVSGKFELINNPEIGMFFKISGAKKL